MAHLAKACTQENPQLRPSMRSIVVALMTLSSATEDWDLGTLYENQSFVSLMSGRWALIHPCLHHLTPVNAVNYIAFLWSLLLQSQTSTVIVCMYVCTSLWNSYLYANCIINKMTSSCNSFNKLCILAMYNDIDFESCTWFVDFAFPMVCLTWLIPIANDH